MPACPILSTATLAPTRTAATTELTAGILIFVLGSVVNVLAYDALAPLVVALVFLLLPLAALALHPGVDGHERHVFVLVFAVCWFWAGVAAAYTAHSGVVFSDAEYFFEEVTRGDGLTQSVADTLRFTENGGAVVIWRFVYDAFSLLGVEQEPYVGVAMNVCFVALTGVVGIKMVKAAFGPDLLRIRRFSLLFSLCGLFWLFASIHIRDAAVLLSVSLLTLFWLKFLGRPNLGTATTLGAGTIGAVLCFGLLRNEEVLVPVAMIGAGTASLAVTGKHGSTIAAALVVAGVLATAVGKYAPVSITGKQSPGWQYWCR